MEQPPRFLPAVNPIANEAFVPFFNMHGLPVQPDTVTFNNLPLAPTNH
jgi:hypothetical protein